MSLFRSFSRVAILTGISLVIAQTVFAETQSSTNFQNVDSSILPAAQLNITSANYQISGSLEPMVGTGQSANYLVQTGVPFLTPSTPSPTLSPTPSGGGGLGSTGYIPLPYGGSSTTDSSIPLPTLNVRRYTFKSTQTIFGIRPGADYRVIVNGSDVGIQYPDATAWQRIFPLFLGINDVVVASKISTGATSPVVRGQIERILIGDVNRNHIVDDYDLSLFTRAWHRYSFFADFNEDSVIDDADLSLLASHWGRSF